MKVALSFVLLLNALAPGMRRGPHHPQGQESNKQKHQHSRPRGGVSLTRESELLHDIEHIKEDNTILSHEYLSRLTPEELELFYFLAHDFDKNTKLDGLELLKAIYHTLDHEDPDSESDSSFEPKAYDLDAYIEYVDRTLESDDTDGDGYVSYSEYRAARSANLSEITL